MKNPFSSALTASALIWLSASLSPGQDTTQILKDINVQSPVADESVKKMVKLGDNLIIAIDTPITGSELWRSDGSPEGTELILDIIPGIAGSNPEQLTVVQNRVYFTALNAEGARSLWVTTGETSGTRLLKTFPIGQDPTRLTAFRERLIFSGFDATNGHELWHSNGTPNGTVINRNINPAAEPSHPRDFFNLGNNLLYFTANTPATGRELWVMNSEFSTAPYNQTLDGFDSYFSVAGDIPIELTQMGSSIYFIGSDEPTGKEIYKTDGAGGFQLVANVAPGSLSSDPNSLRVMPVVNGDIMENYLFFVANNNSIGSELYRTNGTTIELMRDISPDSSSPAELTVAGSRLFFSADAGAGRALYRSNGLTGGTTNTAVVTNSIAGSNPENLTPFDADEAKLIFTATNTAGRLGLYFAFLQGDVNSIPIADFGVGSTVSNFVVDYGDPGTLDDNVVYFLVNGSELWVTDGIDEGGTYRIKNFQEGSASSFPSNFAVLSGNTAYFAADNGLNGQELWKSNGTSAGTTMVQDIQAGVASSSPTHITASGAHVYFSAAQGGNRELWMTDGTEGGTQMVRTASDEEINPSGPSDPMHLTDLDGVLYFSAQTAGFGREPWKTDGTRAGTSRIADLVPNAGGSDPSQFVRYRGDVYFVSVALNQGIRLRNEKAPSVGIQDALLPNTAGPLSPTELLVMGTTSANQRMYFAAEFPGRGRELWRSDGTNAGTECFDINTGPNNSNPEFLTPVGNALFFVANTGTGPTDTGRELFRSTGSLTTTKIVKDIVVGTGSSNPQQLTAVGEKLFFTAETASSGRELWVSTGTAAGTVMVKEIVAEAGSPDITDMRDVDGILVFSADDGVHGREVWISDGTASGTVMLEDLAPLSASSNPSDFTAFQGQLLYAAADPVRGVEPRLAFIGSNIQVRLEDDILAQNDVVTIPGSFAMKAKSAPLELTIDNIGINTLSNIKILIGGPNKAEFKLTAPKAAKSVRKNESTSFGILFAPKEGGVREATVSIFSNDGDANPFVLNIRGNGIKDPYISDQPDSYMRNVGESVTFTATATSDEPGTLSTQWRKKSAKITGETATGPSPLTTSYNLFGITLKDAGPYNIEVIGTNNKAISNSGELGVVQDNIPPVMVTAGVGGSVSLKVVAAGNLLTYQWMRGGIPLRNDSRISGAQGKTLVIRNLVVSDTELYTCVVSNGGGTRIGGSTVVNIFTEAPDVFDAQEMLNGIVGGFYYHKTLIDTNNTQKAPLSYSARGLPPGLKMNAKTGEITGRPTKEGAYNEIIITAQNTLGADESTNQSVVIAPFPSGIEGMYSALVERNSLINRDLGGRLDLNLNTKGTFTGKLMMGGTSIPVKGGLYISVDTDENQNPMAFVDLKPAAKSGLPAMSLNLEFNALTGLLNNAGGADNSLSAGGEIAQINGWRKVDKGATSPLQGYYTMGMEQTGAPVENTPPGWSFATLNVSKDGKVKSVGRTADGEKITTSTIVGGMGQVAFYQPLYTKIRGSMMGELLVDSNGTPDISDNSVSGNLDWVRPPNTSPKSRAYQDGFGLPDTPVTSPVELEAVGEPYFKPTGLILGIFTPPPVPLDLLFSGAGIGTVANTTVTLGEKNKITQSSNIAKLKLNAAKGLFTGTLSLEGGRKSTFLGILLKDGTEEFGAGYFMLPQIQGPGETAKTSPILGGTVELSKQAPPP
jgi:ELWxxDGT repeat protein